MEITVNDVIEAINEKFNTDNPTVGGQIEVIVDGYENGDITKEEVATQISALVGSIDSEFVVENDYFEPFNAKFDGIDYKFDENNVLHISLDLECVDTEVNVKSE